MKKTGVSLLLLFLIGVLLLYNYLLNRYETDWEIRKEHPQALAKNGSENNSREVLFLNDMFRNYENFSYQKEFFTAKYTIDLNTVSVIQGNVKKSKGKIEVRGKEAIFGIRGIKRLLKKEKADILRMRIETNEDIEIRVFEVRGKISPWKPYSDIDFDFLIHRLSRFTFLAKVPGKPGGQKLDIELSNYYIKGKRRANGLVLVIKSRQDKDFKLHISELSLKRYTDKIAETFPAIDYYKHGKTWLKSLFIPVNSTITYKIKAGEKFSFSGYLGAFPGEALQYEIKADGKTVLSQPVTTGLTYFCREVTPSSTKKGTLIEIAVKNKDKNNGAGVLGNFTFFRKKEEKPKNFVFYLIDALRGDYGGLTEAKELFESHFKEGAIFKNAYANAAWTADSLAVIFSGKYKFSLVDDQVYHPNLAEEEFLLAEYMKGKGYATAAFIANSFLVKNNSYQGFDFVYLCWKGKRDLSMFPSRIEYTAYKYGDMEVFIRDFARQNRDKKLFIYIHTLEPHDPYELPLEMRRYSRNIGIELLKSVYGKFKIFLKNPVPEQVETLKALYRDEVPASYDFFEKTTGLFEQEGILSGNSLYLLTADHGERFFEHGSWVHGRPDVYNEVLRIPFMMKGPGIKPGYYEKNVQLADIYPTVMDWLGDRKVGAIVGDSLLTYIHGKADNFNNRVIYADGTKHPFQYAYITGDIKIIIENDRNRVYDLSIDPGETKNLAGEKRFSEMIKAARRFRGKFKKSSGKKDSGLNAEERERLKSLGYIDE